jgi:hypothetical protein
LNKSVSGKRGGRQSGAEGGGQGEKGPGGRNLRLACLGPGGWTGDSPSLVYLKRCQRYRLNPPDKDWDGIVNLSEK